MNSAKIPLGTQGVHKGWLSTARLKLISPESNGTTNPLTSTFLAETERFELSVPLRVLHLSRVAH